MELLLKNRADPNQKNTKGVNCLDIARTYDDVPDSVMDLLKVSVKAIRSQFFVLNFFKAKNANETETPKNYSATEQHAQQDNRSQANFYTSNAMLPNLQAQQQMGVISKNQSFFSSTQTQGASNQNIYSTNQPPNSKSTAQPENLGKNQTMNPPKPLNLHQVLVGFGGENRFLQNTGGQHTGQQMANFPGEADPKNPAKITIDISNAKSKEFLKTFANVMHLLLYNCYLQC